MRMRAILACLLLVGLSHTAPARVQIADIDAYPLAEVSGVKVQDPATGAVISEFRFSLFAGLIQGVRCPARVKFRIVPFIYQRTGNQHHVQLVLLNGAEYAFDSKKPTPAPTLMERYADPANSSLLSWRRKSERPYLSGGAAALMGQVIINYGFRAPDGSRYRAWKMTPAFFYADNERHGRKITSLGGLVLSLKWKKPGKEKSWDFGLFANCFSLGRREGRRYGRVFWFPIGKAPALLPQPPEREKPAEKPTPSPSPRRKRFSV